MDAIIAWVVVIGNFIKLRKALRQAMNEGNWPILGPIMVAKSLAPEEFQRALLAAISRRSGLNISSESHDDYVTVESEAPLSYIFV